jgi:hypothetical protein
MKDRPMLLNNLSPVDREAARQRIRKVCDYINPLLFNA